MTGLRIFPRHLRAACLCTRGARTWLAAHGFEVARFAADGIAAEELEATGDHFALTVCRIARDEAQGRNA